MKKTLLTFATFVLFTNVYSQCGHYFENKLFSLSDVRFWDENNGFVIGGASLLTTNNGGDSWQSYELPVLAISLGDPLIDMELIDGNKAIVVGRDGIILYTNNKGLVWERRTGLNAEENFTGVSFINSEIGYLVGYRPSGSNYTSFLYKTTDGGENWTELFSNYSYFTFDDVLFINENIGYMWKGDELYKTIDGGEEFSLTGMSGQGFIKKVQFTDINTGYLSAGNNIFKTVDGGNTWAQTDFYVEWTTGTFTINNNFLYYSTYVANAIYKVDLNSGTEIYSNFEQDGYATDIFFINDSVGYIVGKKEQSLDSMGRFIYKTVDSGLTWTPLDSGSPMEGNGNEATFFKKINPNEFIYSILSVGMVDQSYVLLSEDNGNSWQKVYGTPDRIGYILYAEGNYISHWTYSNPYNYGEGYIISQSFDKGTTWTDSPIRYISELPADISFDYSDLAEGSSGDLFLLDYEKIYRSLDLGNTWNLIPTPPNLITKKFQIIDSDNIFIYGQGTNDVTKIYKTTNGGEQWDLLFELTDVYYDPFNDRTDFNNPNQIYVYPSYPGDQLYVYDLRDQSLVQRTLGFGISKISAINDDSIIVLTYDQNIFISHDKGLSWSPRFWVGYSTLYPNIYVENEDNIYLWDYNFIQNLKSYSPSAPEVISGNRETLINTEEEYFIPTDLFSTTEWILESGGTLITETNTQYFKAKVLWEVEGVHTLKAKRENECGESAFTEIQVAVNGDLKVVDELEVENIAVYPNPFDENLHISITRELENRKLNITLKNSLGQTVYNITTPALSGMLNLNDIPQSISPGVYIFELKTDGLTIIKKLIKK